MSSNELKYEGKNDGIAPFFSFLQFIFQSSYNIAFPDGTNYTKNEFCKSCKFVITILRYSGYDDSF